MYFALVLHAHIPYVISHGSWPHGQVWLLEAAAETYVPILMMLHDLMENRRKPHLTINLSPILCEQLSNESFINDLSGYLEDRISQSNDDMLRFEEAGLLHRAYLAKTWMEFYNGVKDAYEKKFDRNIIGAFRNLQDSGIIEIITCCATHGYLPLLGTDESVNMQIDIGVRTYKRHFGVKPHGIWLPECAYRPGYEWKAPVGDYASIPRKGVEHYLAKHGIKFFFVDSHMISDTEAR